ncbi:MAG: DUF4079 family protein [bacterium]
MSGLTPFIHPALMTAILALGLFLLAVGLRIRKHRRQGGGPKTARLAALHMRFGRWFIGFLAGGYILGLVGMRFSLGEPVYETGHSYFGTITLIIFFWTAYLGRRLRQHPGRDDYRQLHAFCAFIAIFLALVVAFLGFQLLP